MTNLGLNISHDNHPVGRDGASSWILVYGNIFFEYPSWSPPLGNMRFEHIVQLHRDPVQVIASRISNRFEYLKQTFRNLSPDIAWGLGDNRKLLGQAASLALGLRHWVAQNRLVESVADGWLHVDDGQENLQLCRRLLENPMNCQGNVLQRVSNSSNHASTVRNISWTDLLAVDPI